jgi:hypothetical protein
VNWINTPESSNIARFAYDPQSQVLTVEFNHGGTYNYFDVPNSTFEQMQAAPSKGTFLASAIKGNHRYSRL